MKKDTYTIFKGTTPDEPGYGVTGTLGGMVYEATFLKETAERIVQLENSSNPPKDWEATSEILTKEGYDVRCLARSPVRKDIESPQNHVTTSVKTGAFQVDTIIDSDGHLTIIVKSTDGSEVFDTEDEVGCNADELGYRFTTGKIEADYKAES